MKVIKNIEFRDHDNWGSGHFGASRSGGSRKHIGVDLKALPGEYVYAPFAGEITKYGWAYNNADFRYIEITGSEYRCRIFYTELDSAFSVGSKIPANQFIGIAQDLRTRYTGITPHIHFELYDHSGNIIDPTELLKKKV